MMLSAEQQRLVDSNLPLVEHVVVRVSVGFPRHVDRSELVAAGTLGLVEAAQRYEESRGVPFARYAALRIRGAVLDAVRSADWAPRSVRQLARQADAASQEFASAEGRTPTDIELAGLLGIEAEELVALRGRLHQGVVQSLDPRGNDEAGEPSTIERLLDRSAMGPDEALEQEELKGYLRSALKFLPERHRMVIIGYYFERRSFEELATLLGVTPSRISQLRSDAVAMIKDGIEAQYRSREEAKPHGRVAIRRSRFAAQISADTDWRRRLEPTGCQVDHVELPGEGRVALAASA